MLEAEATTAVVETGTPDGPATGESGGETEGDTLTGGEFPPSSEELDTVMVSRDWYPEVAVNAHLAGSGGPHKLAS